MSDIAADYAALIRRQAGAVAAPVVLAHSGAGQLLPAAARALQARHQVWLAAWVPDPQASFVEDTNLDRQIAFDPDWIGQDPNDRTIRPEWQRRMARDRLGLEPIELPIGHCPNVSHPTGSPSSSPPPPNAPEDMPEPPDPGCAARG